MQNCVEAETKHLKTRNRPWNESLKMKLTRPTRIGSGPENSSRTNIWFQTQPLLERFKIRSSSLCLLSPKGDPVVNVWAWFIGAMYTQVGRVIHNIINGVQRSTSVSASLSGMVPPVKQISAKMRQLLFLPRVWSHPIHHAVWSGYLQLGHVFRGPGNRLSKQLFKDHDPLAFLFIEISCTNKKEER